MTVLTLPDAPQDDFSTFRGINHHVDFQVGCGLGRTTFLVHVCHQFLVERITRLAFGHRFQLFFETQLTRLQVPYRQTRPAAN